MRDEQRESQEGRAVEERQAGEDVASDKETRARLEREADCAALEVLFHDLRVVRAAKGEEEGEKPSGAALERALDRLARLGANRVPQLFRSLAGEIDPNLRWLELLQDLQLTASAEDRAVLERLRKEIALKSGVT